MVKKLPKLICIVGPTASGKTALAIKLAKKFNGEIVSADSRQVYRGMDIGTAKPLPAAMKKIKHHLIDIKNPDENYTLGQYKTDAVKAIKKIIKAGKMPLLVGGTGLYISAIVNNLAIPQVKPNKQLRRKLEQQINRYGLYYVYGKLTALDAEAAYVIDPKNPRRVVRAYEIALETKKPLSATRKKGKPAFDTLILGLTKPGERLQADIAKRTNLMLRQGLVREVTGLLNKYGARQVPFDAIGYREIIDYLRGKMTLPEGIALINRNTWHFAKRQMNWFKKMPVVWVKSFAQAEKASKRFVRPT